VCRIVPAIARNIPHTSAKAPDLWAARRAIKHHGRVETLRTNSDLYLAVVTLGKSEPAQLRTLDEFLRAFWLAGYDHREQGSLSPAEFLGLLTTALDGPVPAFDPFWAKEDLSLTDGVDAFTIWARTLRAQICDIRELSVAGLYQNLNRHHGVTAPRPNGVEQRPTPVTWYNFDVPSYLECGVEGSFGGWRPEFDGAVVDGEPCEPLQLSRLTWTELTKFTVCGQSYE
jgi:hypothetical protein